MTTARKLLSNEDTHVHAKPRTPINPETYNPVGPYALTTSHGYHDCKLSLADGIAAFVRYAHPVDHIIGTTAFLADFDGVVVLGYNVWAREDPVKWFGIPEAAQLFADNPLVDPLEAEIVMMKVREPA